MEEHQKKIDLTLACMLLILALMNDAAVLAADFGMAMVVGVSSGGILATVVTLGTSLLPTIAVAPIGIVIFGLAELFNFLTWASVFGLFIMIEGFGAPALLQLVGGIAEFFGVPCRTLTVLAGILIINNPRLHKAAEIAEVATSAGNLASATSLETLQEGRRVLSRPADAPAKTLQDARRPLRSADESIISSPLDETKEELFKPPDELQDNEFKLAA